MPTFYVRTIVYLEPDVRQLLEGISQRTAVPVSVLIRDAIALHLDDRTIIKRSEWFEHALRLLLRYHPQGDLEKISDEILNNAQRRRVRT
jgi:hypothetical protein